MVVPFRKPTDSAAPADRRSPRLPTGRRALTSREITHRERMLAHLKQTAVLRPPR